MGHPVNRNVVLDRFHKFLDLHFADGDVNVPSWRQPPYLYDAFSIFSDARDVRVSADDLIRFLKTNWNITNEKRPTTLRSSEIDDFCKTLQAWELYEYCRTHG